MEVKRVGSQLSAKGPSEWFSGTVRIDPLFQAPDPTIVSGASVTFEPGARPAWHTHPLGQTLIVTAGCGWAQRCDGPIEEIRPGDVVLVLAGRKTLAWRYASNGNDARRHSRKKRRQGCRMAGVRERRAVRKTIGDAKHNTLKRDSAA
jgi:quercetin dioxygenase-like cupin family protein